MLTIPRGNSLTLTVTINNADKTPHILSPTEQAVFTVKITSRATDKPLVQKIITADDYNEDNELVIKLDPEDTINLAAGDYEFDFAVLVDGKDFYTVYCKDIFRITPALGDKAVFDNG